MTVAFWRDAAAVTVVRPSVRIWLFWVVRCMARTSGSEKLPPTVNSSETVLSHPASTICKLYVPAASPSNWKRPRSLVVCVALVGPTVVSLTLTSGRPVAASTTLPLIEYVSADAIRSELEAAEVIGGLRRACRANRRELDIDERKAGGGVHDFALDRVRVSRRDPI